MATHDELFQWMNTTVENNEAQLRAWFKQLGYEVTGYDERKVSVPVLQTSNGASPAGSSTQQFETRLVRTYYVSSTDPDPAKRTTSQWGFENSSTDPSGVPKWKAFSYMSPEALKKTGAELLAATTAAQAAFEEKERKDKQRARNKALNLGDKTDDELTKEERDRTQDERNRLALAREREEAQQTGVRAALTQAQTDEIRERIKGMPAATAVALSGANVNIYRAQTEAERLEFDKYKAQLDERVKRGEMALAEANSIFNAAVTTYNARKDKDKLTVEQAAKVAELEQAQRAQDVTLRNQDLSTSTTQANQALDFVGKLIPKAKIGSKAGAAAIAALMGLQRMNTQQFQNEVQRPVYTQIPAAIAATANRALENPDPTSAINYAEAQAQGQTRMEGSLGQSGMFTETYRGPSARPIETSVVDPTTGGAPKPASPPSAPPAASAGARRAGPDVPFPGDAATNMTIDPKTASAPTPQASAELPAGVTPLADGTYAYDAYGESWNALGQKLGVNPAILADNHGVGPDQLDEPYTGTVVLGQVPPARTQVAAATSAPAADQPQFVFDGQGVRIEPAAGSAPQALQDSTTGQPTSMADLRAQAAAPAEADLQGKVLTDPGPALDPSRPLTPKELQLQERGYAVRTPTAPGSATQAAVDPRTALQQPYAAALNELALGRERAAPTELIQVFPTEEDRARAAARPPAQPLQYTDQIDWTGSPQAPRSPLDTPLVPQALQPTPAPLAPNLTTGTGFEPFTGPGSAPAAPGPMAPNLTTGTGFEPYVPPPPPTQDEPPYGTLPTALRNVESDPTLTTQLLQWRDQPTLFDGFRSYG